jgi:hypothetical protein
MQRSLELQVRQRAQQRCEYCRISETVSPVPFEIDHIIAQQHDGETVAGNLALTCLHCNKRKGPNLAGIDSETGEIVRLFHPRNDPWDEHFEWDGPYLRGRTDIGRATVAVLGINHPNRVATREALIESGEFQTFDTE